MQQQQHREGTVAAATTAVGIQGLSGASSDGYRQPEDPMDDYRFYQCFLHPLHTICTSITTADVRRTDKRSAGATGTAAPPSILMAVPKYIPEAADTFWIRVNMFFMQKTSIR
jgi:hypothetical protein